MCNEVKTIGLIRERDFRHADNPNWWNKRIEQKEQANLIDVKAIYSSDHSLSCNTIGHYQLSFAG